MVEVNGRFNLDFSSDDFEIFTGEWYDTDELGISIVLENKTSDEYSLSFNYAQLEEISKLINNVLNQDEENPNYPHKAEDKVKIISGKFKGLQGTIYDIDECDKKRPLAIHIISSEFDGNVYCNYEDVEIIKLERRK